MSQSFECAKAGEEKMHNKPQLLPKSLVVMLAAKEIRLMKQTILKRSHSDSEIYDDIINLRTEEIYDDILSVYPISKENVKCSDADAKSVFASLADKVPHSGSLEDVYDDIVALKPQKVHRSSKPKVPIKPDYLFSHPKVKELLHRCKLKKCWEFEEIYDMTTFEQPDNSDGIGSSEFEAEEVYIDPAFINVSDDESESGYVITRKPTSSSKHEVVRSATCEPCTLPSTRNTSDSLPDVEDPQPLKFVISSSEDDVYEDLALYEDVDKYQNHRDDYEDPTDVVVKALDLPETIRQRTTRLVPGPLKSKLRKSIKKFKSRSLGPNCLEKIAPHQLECKPHSGIDSGGNDDDPEQLVTTSTHPQVQQQEDTSSDSEDNSQVPSEKARIMFDLLLDASDIVRIPDKTFPDKKPELEIAEVTTSGECEEELSEKDYECYFDSYELMKMQQSSELQQYKDAGVIQLRSKSDIVADIAEITANAPKEPPPLPGMTRPRTLVVTKPDVVLQKRMRMKKAHTLQSIRELK